MSITAFITPGIICNWMGVKGEWWNPVIKSSRKCNDIHRFRILRESCLIWNVGVDMGDAPSHWTFYLAQPPQLQRRIWVPHPP